MNTLAHYNIKPHFISTQYFILYFDCYLSSFQEKTE